MKAVPTDYDLRSPGSLPAVLDLLATEPGVWTPFAGGTEIMVAFAAGRLSQRRFVNIFNLPELNEISSTETTISIGAGVTYTALRAHPAVQQHLPLLVRAAGWTGSVANQNRGTLGGNLANGSPAADSPPALLAYEAEVEIISAQGSRRIPYAAFHTGYKRNALQPTELLRAVHIPIPAPGTHGYLRKVGPRNAQAISKVALAATARLTNGLILEPRIGLASASHAPCRCPETEACLAGKAPSAALTAEAREHLLAEITPLDDIRSTARYRAAVAANLLAEFACRDAKPINSPSG